MCLGERGQMYVTRPRSLYRKFPGSLSVNPEPDALYSGHLVVSDEESKTMDSCCCGIWRNDRIKRVPFPQDRILKVVHSDDASITKVWLVPVIDQPLSSSRYYVIKAKGRRKGQAYTCTREGDGGMCCFNTLLADPKIRPFDYRDRYQQFEIRPYHSGGFFAKSIEWDGYPPTFLRKGGWEIYTSHSPKLHLRESQGLHGPTTSNLPELDVQLYAKRSTPILVGRWLCPFIFVKEEKHGLKHQMRKSLVYEFSLKQWWEEIYSCKNENNKENVVVVNKRVKRLGCLVNGMEAEKDGVDDSGFVWFRVDRKNDVGLSCIVYEKMRWLQESRGWFDGEKEVVVCGGKEAGSGNNGWRKFGCYVLMESLMIRRMDGSLVINFMFRNAQKIECKWQ